MQSDFFPNVHRSGLLALVLAAIIAAEGSCDADDALLPPKSVPVVSGANGLAVNEKDRTVTYQTGTEIDGIAAFYDKQMQELGFEQSFHSVASFFTNLKYKKNGKMISINAKRGVFGTIATVTITGDGISWPEGPMPAPVLDSPSQETPKSKMNKEKPAAEQRSATIRSRDFPLLDAQSTSKDGSMEMIQFNSRKTVDENVAFHSEGMSNAGWKRTVLATHGDLTLMKFEQLGMSIRIGLWPRDFSDNRGSYHGARGAAEGSGIAWDGDKPSGGVPERMLSDYQRSLGKLPPEKAKEFKRGIARVRERVLTNDTDVPDDIWDGKPDRTE